MPAMNKPELSQLVALLALLSVLALGGCSDSSNGGNDDPSVEDDDAVAYVRLEGAVQDFWVFERLQRIGGADGELTDISPAVVEHLQSISSAEKTVELMPDVRFTVIDALEPRLLVQAFPDAETSEQDDTEYPSPDHWIPRDDVTVVAGLLEYDGEGALAILATPDDDAEQGVGFHDVLEFDLTFLEDDLQPGDALLADFAFAQGLPDGEDPGLDDGFTTLDLFAHRLEQEQIEYFGLVTDGEPEVLLYTGQIGTVVEGSTRGRMPGKASDLQDGMNDGLVGCLWGKGIKCVASFFRGLRDGATSSFDQSLRNGGLASPDDGSGGSNGGGGGRRPFCFFRCGEANGDPHMVTVDGTRYDMMAVGEFTLLENQDIEIQMRASPWRDSDSVSMATAAAIGFGDHRVTVDRDLPEHERIRVNGDIVDPAQLRQEPIVLDGARIALYGSTMQIEYGDYLVSVRDSLRGLLSIYVSLPEDLDVLPQTRGLLGDVSGNPDTDFYTRDGRVLTQPLSDEELYDDFVEGWRITDEISLFDYPPGKGTEDYTEQDFPRQALTVDDLTPEQRAFAEAVCEAAGIVIEESFNDCLYDVGFTGDPTFATVARTAEVAERIRRGELDPDAMPLGGRPALGTPIEIEWATTFGTATGREVRLDLNARDGQLVAIRCPEAPDPDSFPSTWTVYGTDVYFQLSPICGAAVHMGMATFEDGGSFVIRYLEDFPNYEVEPVERNGIEPEIWSKTAWAFQVLP